MLKNFIWRMLSASNMRAPGKNTVRKNILIILSISAKVCTEWDSGREIR
jgi:hypothetical protein